MDGAVVRLHDRARDRQSKSCTPTFPRTRLFSPIKALEHMRLILRGNPLTAIGNLKPYTPVPLQDPHIHMSASRGVPHGITNQVDQNPLHARTIET